jgi:hypothetical protein
MSRHRDKRIKASMQMAAVPTLRPTVSTAQPVALSYRFIKAGKSFCLSHCKKDDIRAVADCLRQLTTMTWEQVRQSGGRGENKVGLGYTPYKDSELNHVQRPPEFSKDISIAAVRATQKMRVFGGYKGHVFYLLWFDPDHKIIRA